MVQVVSNLFHGEWRAAFDAACQTAVDIWNIIVDTFEGIDLFQIGKDIINGLIDGISSMASAAWDAVGNIASGIKDAVTGFFDIRSPSRLMFEQGAFVTEGFSLGIVHKADMAVQSAKSVAEKSSIPFATDGKGKSYTSNSVNNSNKSNVTNKFEVTISADTARAMNEDDSTFKELADKFINYVADKLDDVSNARTDVNLGVMEQ